MAKKPTKYMLLTIGYSTYLLPGSTNLNTIVGAFSKAIEVRMDWHNGGAGGEYYYPIADDAPEIEIKSISASKVYSEKQREAHEEEDNMFDETPPKSLGQGNLRIL